ncbi:MAG: fused MFS/spermidine synthase, partial [Chloroflexales bacterium]|nr:fused MFS/spermidine synthase [Chloroflexales bacterium]
LSLSNESTLHGQQVLDKKNRRLPTTYYTRGSAAGIVLNSLHKQQPALRLGAIGLGTGTLAAYGRKDDHLVFWDINPLAIKLARERFYFLRDCPSKMEISQSDGRLGLAASRDLFDVIVLDAFAGDSIPAHLITREAIASYLARLDHGILLVHISNRYLDPFPVVAGGARYAGWKCLYVNSTPHESAKLTLAKGTLKAPFAGVVSQVNIDVGDIAGGASQLPAVQIVDISELRVEVNVSDTDVARVRESMAADVTVDAIPGQTFAGTVTYVAPTATVVGNVRTYAVRITLDEDHPEGLRAGMSARVAIKVEG